MADSYRVISTTVVSVREKSIIIQMDQRQGTNVLARSLIQGFDDLHLEKLKPVLPRRTTFRVFSWKAEELGLA